MTIYSFRAECAIDVERFKEGCSSAGIVITLETFKDEPQYPDVQAQLTTTTTLEALLAVMADVEDGHVMYETLKPCALKDNNMERERDSSYPPYPPQ